MSMGEREEEDWSWRRGVWKKRRMKRKDGDEKREGGGHGKWDERKAEEGDGKGAAWVRKGEGGGEVVKNRRHEEWLVRPKSREKEWRCEGIHDAFEVKVM
jgi:hypothetical protein